MRHTKKTLIAFAFTFASVGAYAQLDRQWVKEYTDADTAYRNVIGLFNTSDGSVIKASLSTKHQPPEMYNRLHLQKINSGGNPVWEEIYTHPDYDQFSAYKAGTDAAGNLYFAGQTTAGQSGYWFVISFDDKGQFRWKKEIVENTFDDGYARTLAVDPSGNVYVSGNVNGGGDNYGVIVKYDTNGNELWVKKESLNYSIGAAMMVTANGDLVVSDENYEITRFSPAGAELWSTPDTTSNFIYVHPALVESSDGSIYGISFLGFNYALKKLSSSGVFEWAKQDFEEYLAFGDLSVELKADAEGNVYAYGLNSTDTTYQTAVFKIDPSGEEIWEQTFQDMPNNEEVYEIYDMEILPNGKLALAGSVNQSVYYASAMILDEANGEIMDIDTITSSAFNPEFITYNSGGLYVAGTGNYATYLVNYSGTVSLEENEPKEAIIDVFPNPFTDGITLRSDFAMTKFELMTAHGELISSGKAAEGMEIQLSGIAAGVYLLNVYGENGQQAVRRIVKK